LFDEKYRQILKEILSDENKLREELKDKKGLIDFINSIKARKTLEKIIEMSDTQLSEYRRAGMIMPQKISEAATSREKLIKLLRFRKVSEFNALRDREGLEEIDLRGANLSMADLRGANLSVANLVEASLSRASLGMANLSMANMSMANLSMADLSMANLSMANLSMANLSMANLSMANLVEANLSGAVLRSGIILIKEQYYRKAKVSDANFEDALIGDRGFLEYLRENGAKSVPDEVSTKDVTINEMKKRGLDVRGIEQFFDE
jgi:uncharacterized protein YjbI with pentapeptide repeats